MLPTYVFAGFLVIHGLIHLSWNAPKPDDPKYPFDLTRSPVLKTTSPELLKTLGSTLVTLAAIEFIAAGAALILLPAIPTLWRVLAVVGALDSLALIVLYWNKWFVVGALLDVVIFVLAVIGWPV